MEKRGRLFTPSSQDVSGLIPSIANSGLDGYSYA